MHFCADELAVITGVMQGGVAPMLLWLRYVWRRSVSYLRWLRGSASAA